MASCALTRSVDLNCDDKRKVGGNAQRAWIVSDMTGFSVTTDVNGYITALSFGTYAGLVTLEGMKNSHSGGYTLFNTEGGNKGFYHDVILKTIQSNPDDAQALEDIAVGEGAIILETRNQEFIIYGVNNGMDQNEGAQNSGSTAESDLADILTFRGEERELPKRVLSTDYSTTLTLLEGYEI